MDAIGVLLTAGARWLGAGALDGSLLAGLAALAAALLPGSSARLQVLIWRGVLLQFVLVRPFELHALPLESGRGLGLEARVQSASQHGLELAASLLYAGIVSFLLARLLLARRRTRVRVAGYAHAQAEILARVRSAAAALSLRALPAVRVTDEPLAPFTLGPTNPTLVLPRRLCVPGERLDAVLLHELAHLRRGDHWWLGLERVIVCVFFFCPPIHWVSRQLDLARELACDELALRRGGFSASGYGAHLIEVVRSCRAGLGFGAALGVGRTASRLEQRIDRLIALAGARRSRAREAAALLVLAAASLLALRPRELVRVAPAELETRAQRDTYGEGAEPNQCIAAPEEPLPSCALRAAQL